MPASQAQAELPKLAREDYMQIDFWFKHQWISSSSNRVTDVVEKAGNENENDNDNDNDNEDNDIDGTTENDLLRPISPAPGTQRGQGRSRTGINVSMCYIQNKDGQVIDGHRAREIRIHARAVFVGFAMKGTQFASWGDADAQSRRFFYNEMVIRFEELQYCDLDWKAEQIATDTFPGWKVTWVKKQKKVSLEQHNGLKRSRQKSNIDIPALEQSKPTEMDAVMSSSGDPQVGLGYL